MRLWVRYPFPFPAYCGSEETSSILAWTALPTMAIVVPWLPPYFHSEAPAWGAAHSQSICFRTAIRDLLAPSMKNHMLHHPDSWQPCPAELVSQYCQPAMANLVPSYRRLSTRSGKILEGNELFGSWVRPFFLSGPFSPSSYQTSITFPV